MWQAAVLQVTSLRPLSSPILSLKIRLYGRPNAIQRGSGDYALQITKRLLQFYEEYFKVKYSLPKLGKSQQDHIFMQRGV